MGAPKMKLEGKCNVDQIIQILQIIQITLILSIIQINSIIQILQILQILQIIQIIIFLSLSGNDDKSLIQSAAAHLLALYHGKLKRIMVRKMMID